MKTKVSIHALQYHDSHPSPIQLGESIDQKWGIVELTRKIAFGTELGSTIWVLLFCITARIPNYVQDINPNG